MSDRLSDVPAPTPDLAAIRARVEDSPEYRALVSVSAHEIAKAHAERDAANARLRDMGSREEDMENEIGELRATEGRMRRALDAATRRAGEAERERDELRRFVNNLTRIASGDAP